MTGAAVIVVAAVIERGGTFLVTRRPDGVHLAGYWEFPGGKVDRGETHAAALRRELREELGVEARVGDLVHAVTHAYPEKTVALYFYRCEYEGTPAPRQEQEMRWVARCELSALPFPEADRHLIALLARTR
jgi:mutator protein MutT